MARDRALAAIVRDALVVAAIAVLVVQALRRWGGDRYVVPSNSMQPVLHGDDRHGDVVFVDKWSNAAARRRHDLVVVQHPEKPGQQLVKRIAARGDDVTAGCWIDIREGDVWLGESRQVLTREQKDPLAARGQQVSWAVLPGAAAGSSAGDPVGGSRIDMGATGRGSPDDSGTWTLPPMADSAIDARSVFGADARADRRRKSHVVPTGAIGTTRCVDASYIDATGARGGSGHDVGVNDCGMTLDLRSVAELLCTIDARGEAMTFHTSLATGRVELWRNGEVVAATTWAWRPQPRHRIEFGRLDDRFYFVVDDRRDALFLVPRDANWPVEADPVPGGPRTWLHVGVVGREPVRIAAVRVFRDLYAFRERIAGFPGDPGQWPRFVAPGTWFLLGDNPFDSRDSRNFDTVPSTEFIGRPLFVLGPWPRCRWLHP